ncbi:hypothetical protein DKX38_017725 [Salix brachista]|uniref:F-box domain-containing protein n=1 Tax=Salix brachista TaxID=2182728 RepID=A0A5N5KW19_9ROSI|nr:hypothetical protein DKX38_017725 [Salix brachista]
MSDFLPEDLIQEILFKLPIKSLVRCTSLSRTWNSLIKSPAFISKHLQRYQKKDYRILRYRILLFWNPLIQKYVNIKPGQHRKPNSLYPFVGFGYDSRANDYKLIRMVNFQTSKSCSEEIPEMDLYSLNEDLWKRIPQTAPLRYYTDQKFSSAFLNGAVHWIVNWEDQHEVIHNVVLGFDMSDEIFREIALPSRLDNVECSCLSLLVYKESSIAVCQASSGQFHIWVMKEYGVVESWTELVLTFGAQGEGIPRALGIRKEELLMEKKRGWIVSGDLESQQVLHVLAVAKEFTLLKGMRSFLFRTDLDLSIWGEPSHTFTGSYLESLVLLDKGNATSYGYNSNGLAA